MEQMLDVQRDTLTINSTAEEVLHTLIRYGTMYIMLAIEGTERLLHKDRIVSHLQTGRVSETTTMKEMLSKMPPETLASKVNMENIPPATRMLLFSNGELSATTLGAYRNKRISEKKGSIPSWWGAPLPLLNIKDNRALLNDTANYLMHNVKVSDYIDKIREEGLFVIGAGSNKKTYSFVPLADDTYLIEDVSGDFETAEDLVWWASVGKAFVHRMEANGLTVKRLPPRTSLPEGSSIAEVISCSWEGDVVGSLVIELPESDAANTGQKPEQKQEPAPEPKPEAKQEAKPKPAPKRKPKPEAKQEAKPQTEPLATPPQTTAPEVQTEELQPQKPSAEQPAPEEPAVSAAPKVQERAVSAEAGTYKLVKKPRKEQEPKPTEDAPKDNAKETAQPGAAQPSPDPQPKAPKRGKPPKNALTRQEAKPAKKEKSAPAEKKTRRK